MYKTRRALKNLQYSPKGNDIAGQPTTTKRVDHKDAINQLKSNLKTPRKSSEQQHQQKRVKEINDEKENPAKQIELKSFKSIGVQCSKNDEDMICDETPSNDYWRIVAIKRREALDNVLNENKDLHEIIEQLNEENEHLREENKDLLDLLNEANALKEVINETDSGVGADLDKVSVVALKEDVE